MGGNDITSVGNIQIAAAKTLGLGVYSTDPAGLTVADKGKTWFNSAANQMKYWDGTSVQVVGAVGAAVASLNGETGASQSFGTPGSAGIAPAWSSAGNVHTLNIPVASAAGVTAGLLSNTDYATFNAKQPAGSYLTSVTGDITSSGFSSGTVTATLQSVAIPATSTKVTYDAKGRVTSGTSLAASDLPAHSAALITSGTLGVVNGGTGSASLSANAVLLGNGTGQLLAVAPGSSGNVLTSNGTTWTSTAIPSTNWASPGAIGSTTPSSGTFTTITASGSVGIGTTAPENDLHVRGSTYGRVLIDGSAGEGELQLRTNRSIGGVVSRTWRLLSGSPTTQNFRIYDDYANKDRFNVDPNGNVGIGTTSPTSALTIGGNAEIGYSGELVNRSLTIWSSNASSKRGILSHNGTDFVINGSVANQNLKLGANPGTIFSTIQFNANGTTTNPYVFSIADSARMVMDNSGNVGIGTNAPTSNLNIYVPNSQTPVGAMSVDVGSFSDPTNAAASYYFRVRDIGAGPVTPFIIKGTGNVGIGTISPSSLLAVNGQIESKTGGFKFPDGTVQSSAAFSNGVTTLTESTTISVNAAAANVFNITLTGNRTMANPSNLMDGQMYTFRITQDATGGRTLTWGSSFVFGSNVANSTLQTGAGQYNIFTFVSDGTKLYNTGFFASCLHGSQVFTYTGTDQSFTLPVGACAPATVKIWGAGGGGGNVGGWSYGAPGGGGGFTSGKISLTPGASHTVVVGQGGFVNSTAYPYGGGGPGSCNGVNNVYGSNGAGLSGLFSGTGAVFSGGVPQTGAQARALLIAGGGGGGGSSRAGTGNSGGPGGGATAADGSSPYDGKTGYRGRGGTQAAPGATASSDGAGCEKPPAAMMGGAPRTNGYGGGGGSGYYGGSAGGYSEANTMGGGGGGSSYVDATVQDAVLYAGTGQTPANTGDSDYQSGVGVGGNVSSVGGNGRVVISW
jgi:hypothetical protein